MLHVFVPLHVVLHPKGGLDPEIFQAASTIWVQPSLRGNISYVLLPFCVPEALQMEARGLGEPF